MSLRGSAPNPFACSGAMYAGVPRIAPAFLGAMLSIVAPAAAVEPGAASIAFARPKSSTLTLPSGVCMHRPHVYLRRVWLFGFRRDRRELRLDFRGWDDRVGRDG